MRIAGITLPDEKRMEIALTAVYGIGRPLAHTILDSAQIPFGKKAKDLTADEEKVLLEAVGRIHIEGDLRRDVSRNIKRLKDISSHRGNRHSRHLPVRGQRTKTNNRTVRGNVRKTMTSGRRKVEKN